MLSKEPRNEQEKRFLGALKLFLEADPRHGGDGKILDELRNCDQDAAAGLIGVVSAFM